MNMEASKEQLAYETIPSLGWPAMTMWFALRNPLPKDVMVGDSVRFELENPVERMGNYPHCAQTLNGVLEKYETRPCLTVRQ